MPLITRDSQFFDFHVFVPLKKALKGQQFQTDAEVQQPAQFNEKGISLLITQWDSSLST
jgi:hypothetical protein